MGAAAVKSLPPSFSTVRESICPSTLSGTRYILRSGPSTTCLQALPLSLERVSFSLQLPCAPIITHRLRLSISGLPSAFIGDTHLLFIALPS